MEDFTTQTEPKEPKEDLKTKANRLKESASEYVGTYKDLVKAKATRTASNAAAGVVIGVGALAFTLFFLIFLFTGVAWWVGGLLGSTAGGFFSVAGFFLLLTVLLFALRRKVIVPAIRNMIIKKVYE